MTAVPARRSNNSDIRLSEPHDHHAIGAMLRRRRTNLTRVAREAGLYESACRLALIARGYPDAEAAIARAVGYPVEVLWPDRYPSFAHPIHSAGAGSASRQKRGPAATGARAEA